MEAIHFNPVTFAINLAVGWFLLAFLQTLAVSLFSAGWPDFWTRFLAIALFRNGAGAAINLILVIVLGVGGTALWFFLRR